MGSLGKVSKNSREELVKVTQAKRKKLTSVSSLESVAAFGSGKLISFCLTAVWFLIVSRLHLGICIISHNNRV